MAVVHRVEQVEPVHDHHDSGTGFLLGVIALAIVAFLFLYYLLPVLRSSMAGPQINVPSQVDVNLHQQK